MMNVVQDSSKKGSIHSLLNPQNVSAFSVASLGPSGPLAPNHPHSQGHAAYYQSDYSSPGSFNLRAASWDSSDPDARRKAALTSDAPRLYTSHSNHNEVPQIPSRSPTTDYAYTGSPRTTNHMAGGSPSYTNDGHSRWPSQMNQYEPANMAYNRPIAPMLSGEPTASSGNYHASSVNYPSGYNNVSVSGAGTPHQWQAAERASLRLVARDSSTQPASNNQNGIYTQSTSYYQQHPHSYPSSMVPQQQGPLYTFPSSSNSQFLQTNKASGSTSSKRPHPDTEGDAAPKAKKPKAKGKSSNSDSSNSTPAGTSKRGYNAKKRSEAAFISAQNDALSRAQRDGSQGHNINNASDSQASDNSITEHMLMPELQFARCMSNRYKFEEFPRCVSCTRRWQGDTCRFQGIRYFMRDAQQRMVGISFQEQHSVSQAPVMDFPERWNRGFELEHTKRLKSSIAKALLPKLKAEQVHIKSSEIIRRPRECDVRVTCDTCMTSLFSSSYMCRLCGREVCYECYQQVIELTAAPKTNPSPEYTAFIARREKHAHTNPFFLSCLKRKDHTFGDFSPVTRFVESELDAAVDDMTAILENENEVSGPHEVGPPNGSSTVTSLTTSQTHTHSTAGPADGSQTQKSPSQYPPPSNTQSDLSAPLLYPVDSFPDPITSPIYDDYTPTNVTENITSIPIYRLQIIPASLYDPPRSPGSPPSKPPLAFSSLWKKEIPLLVKDVLPRFKLEWTPQYFMDRYGDQPCLIVECQTDENKRINIREFFSMFGQYTDRKNCWKLKDWPPTAEFKAVFPDLFEDFSQAVPVPDYVRRDGLYNIGSHFPLNAIGPDLGPKMYNALASSQEEGSMGSTRLHMDMADALNVMLSATPCEDGTEGYAVWDLYRAEDSDKIRAFLKKKFGFGGKDTKKNAANGTGGHAGEKAKTTHAAAAVQMVGHDGIHGQKFYLDVELRRQLFEEFGVQSYRLYQRPGDGVFIPAGCAHQVANMADCMKIAIDFVSPENIDKCEKLTKEFREQNQSKVWKEDVLQLRTMMWFAWQSCVKIENSLGGATVPPPPPDVDKSSRAA